MKTSGRDAHITHDLERMVVSMSGYKLVELATSSLGHLHARPDDNFWAARRVAAFSDDMIRAIVKTGQYSDQNAERCLADVLIHRRQKIAQTYLTAINPLVDFALDGQGRLTFQNAAVQAGVSEPPPDPIPPGAFHSTCISAARRAGGP